MFEAACPVEKKSECHISLNKFISDYGTTDMIISDGSKEQALPETEFQSVLRENDITSKHVQVHRSNENPCETVIRDLKKKWCRNMFRSNCPKVLQPYDIPRFLRE